MADPLAQVAPGSPLPTSAATWNGILAAAREFRQPERPLAGRGRTGGVPGTVEAIALNDTGADLGAYKPAAVVGAGGYDVTGANGYDWARRPVLTLDAPAATTDFVGVTLEPIPDGSFGRVAVGGVALCDVAIGSGSHGFANPAAGNTSELISATTGQIRLLHTGSGGSTRRCVVYLGDQITGGGSGGSLSHNQQSLTSNVSLTGSTGTYQDIVSLTLTAGVWGVWYHCTGSMQTTGVGDYIVAKLNGTAFESASLIAPVQVSGVAAYGVGAGFNIATLLSGGTVKLQAARVYAGTVTTSLILGASTFYNSGLFAVKIG